MDPTVKKASSSLATFPTHHHKKQHQSLGTASPSHNLRPRLPTAASFAASRLAPLGPSRRPPLRPRRSGCGARPRHGGTPRRRATARETARWEVGSALGRAGVEVVEVWRLPKGCEGCATKFKNVSRTSKARCVLQKDTKTTCYIYYIQTVSKI